MKRRRGGKYGVAPKAARTLDGVVFASKAEMLRWSQLKLLEHAGEITELRRQVAYPLVLPNGVPIIVGKRNARYTPDFIYVENKRHVIEDVKGLMTEAAKLRIAVFEAIYGVKVSIVRR